ncbi:MAG: MarR family winged helix-turn-helix transcriptional regulator, partial [Acidobacteriota bacterium]
MSRKRPARRRPGSEELAEIRRSCLAMRVQKANRVVVRHYEEKMRRPLGVTAPQFTLLVHLWEGAGRSISFLAASLRVERTTLSRNLRVLEKQGLIALSEEG